MLLTAIWININFALCQPRVQIRRVNICSGACPRLFENLGQTLFTAKTDLGFYHIFNQISLRDYIVAMPGLLYLHGGIFHIKKDSHGNLQSGASILRVQIS